jgi:hypothetical protein
MENHYIEKQLKQLFMNQWEKYFTGAELPITFFYTHEAAADDIMESKNEHRCLICNLNRVREGHTFVFNSESPGCIGPAMCAGRDTHFHHTHKPVNSDDTKYG